MPANDAKPATDETFVFTRVFDAPRELVWKAWTEPDRIAKWLGPKDVQMSVIRHELRPGGVLHSSMTTPGGAKMGGKFVYREIVPMSRLVWVHSFANDRGETVRHPFSATWPLSLLTTVTFEDENGRTKVTLLWEPPDATETERKTFVDGMDGMRVGWGGSFGQLADFLANA